MILVHFLQYYILEVFYVRADDYFYFTVKESVEGGTKTLEALINVNHNVWNTMKE